MFAAGENHIFYFLKRSRSGERFKSGVVKCEQSYGLKRFSRKGDMLQITTVLESSIFYTLNTTGNVNLL